MHHPEVQDRVRSEIRDVVGEEEEEITADHLKELKYMENVLNEAMRYYFKIGETCISLRLAVHHQYCLQESSELAPRTTKCQEWISLSRKD